MPNHSSSQQIQRPRWDNQQTIRLIRLVKDHYSVPQLALPVLLQCLQLMEQHLKVQMVVLDRRDQVKLVVLDLI
jgi:hypothetical protein